MQVRYFRAAMRWRFILLLCLCAAWPAGLAEPADTPAAAFAVSVEGTQRTVVTRTHRGTDDLGCLVTKSDVDRQTLAFSTTRPGRLVVPSSGRAGPASVAVTVQASGSKLRRTSLAGAPPDCDLSPQATETSCRPVRLAGRAVVRLPAPGTISLSGALTRSPDNARCAPSAARGHRFLVASSGTFRPRFVTDSSIERITLRGTAELTDNLSSGARRVTTVRWTLVLTPQP
jgi:hypothetical protein